MLKKILYWKWLLNGYICSNQSINGNNRVSVILASYHIERMKNIQPLVRSILKCDFVDKIIVSNHNPDTFIEDRVKIQDERLRLINQPTRRGPGYCWALANEEEAEFYILIDDDFLISSQQLKILFQHLVEQPEIPHGLTGFSRSKYYQSQEMEVVTLNQIYAITREHLDKYLELTEIIKTVNPSAYESIEPYGHEVIISKTGKNRPRIHNVGQLCRCPTARKAGVAIHREGDFMAGRKKVIDALETVLLNQR